MHDFYDRTLASLNVPYTEDFLETSFGRTHCLTVGDPQKPKLCTIHGGNGITTLNLKLFLPLLSDYCISLLLVPSGIAHGPVLPMIGKMIVPFVKYYFKPSSKTLDAVIETMGGESDDIWREFFDLMMSSYKMELKAPREYSKKRNGFIKSASTDHSFL